jgi:hypothetical protein
MYNPHIHTGHVFLDLGARAGRRRRAASRSSSGRAPATTCRSPDSRPTRPTAAAIWRKLGALAPGIGPSKKLVVLNPNASKRFPMRRLPLDSYADLATQLLDDPDVYVLVTRRRRGEAGRRAHLQARQFAADG